jgi:hypothetical protein
LSSKKKKNKKSRLQKILFFSQRWSHFDPNFEPFTESVKP